MGSERLQVWKSKRLFFPEKNAGSKWWESAPNEYTTQILCTGSYSTSWTALEAYLPQAIRPDMISSDSMAKNMGNNMECHSLPLTGMFSGRQERVLSHLRKRNPGLSRAQCGR